MFGQGCQGGQGGQGYQGCIDLKPVLPNDYYGPKIVRTKIS